MSEARTFLHDTTIVAVATSPGRGGIGIVRLSGPDAFRIAKQFARFETRPKPRTAHYRVLRDKAGARVDDALLTFFPTPHSYTGEDVVEIATHGAPVVLDWIVRRAVTHGATPARAGEFTERAFINHRLDLTGAEAIRDLIDSQTLAQAQQASEQMGGSIASAIRPIKQALIELIATMEAGIDFAEDDIDTLAPEAIILRIGAISQPLKLLLASFAHGRLLREGLRLAIIGKPNAGKSSLFNRLVQRERAIVTATPGTTRDVISEHVAINGIPVELLDTAGLREADNEAERIGVTRSREAAADADAVLLVIDLAQPELSPADPALLQLLAGRAVIVVENKCDLANDGTEAASAAEISNNIMKDPGFSRRDLPPETLVSAWARIRTSAVTGEGIATLQAEILRMAQGNISHAGSATLTNLRQRDAVSRAITDLQQAEAAAQTNTPHEMILLDLHQALQAIDELTGETTPDDILNLIFSTFCIGK